MSDLTPPSNISQSVCHWTTKKFNNLFSGLLMGYYNSVFAGIF
jgi:hypothetical protein